MKKRVKNKKNKYFNIALLVILVILIIAIITMGISSNLKKGKMGKIMPPKEISVSYDNYFDYGKVIFTAPPGKPGYVVATQEKTGKVLWEKKIYDYKKDVNPLLEEDVQWIFIKELKIEYDYMLIITNTKGEKYKIEFGQDAWPPFSKQIIEKPKDTKQNLLFMHKIVGLGDEVYDARTYDQACKSAQNYLDKRYKDIIKFYLLPSDYKSDEQRNIYRNSGSMGGQYSCRFTGVYLKKTPDWNITGEKELNVSEFKKIYFKYPAIEGFELIENYNIKEKAGEVTYFSNENLIPTGPPSNKPSHRHPMLIIQKIDYATTNYSIDIIKENPNGIKYKIWNDHNQNEIEYYFSDPYMNMDTTIEFIVSDKEIYQISTVNFIYNMIPEDLVINKIIETFKKK